ncbi:unnamed protein product [Calicophoron daubneyi]|uniref:Tetraspanin n=1 Tax=Calicophoron daubneyi TaxID=300641 RepID=A0AAV2TXB2_CALDB
MASLSCGYKCLQLMLIVLNTAVILFGIGLIVVGSVSESNLKRYVRAESATLRGLIIFIIAFGCFLSILGIYGFCGACKKNVCCLKTYVALLFIFIAIGIATGIAGFVMKNKVKGYIKTGFDELYNTYNTTIDSRKFIDLVQKELKCCGPEGKWDSKWGDIPPSCYPPSGHPQYTDGCIDSLEAFVKKYVLAVALCIFLFALFQILGMVFAICVVQAIQKGESV